MDTELMIFWIIVTIFYVTHWYQTAGIGMD